MSAKKSTVDLDLIRSLAELLNETDLTEIEVDDDDRRIRLARGGTTHVQASVPPPVQAAPAPAAPSAASAAPAVTTEAEPGTPLKSPMVGTAYLSPSPDADPFVQVGDSVKKGDTVMIVEAMKTMNQIPAPADGKIMSIKVADGQPVEFGEVLLTVA